MHKSDKFPLDPRSRASKRRNYRTCVLNCDPKPHAVWTDAPEEIIQGSTIQLYRNSARPPQLCSKAELYSCAVYNTR